MNGAAAWAQIWAPHTKIGPRRRRLFPGYPRRDHFIMDTSSIPRSKWGVVLKLDWLGIDFFLEPLKKIKIWKTENKLTRKINQTFFVRSVKKSYSTLNFYKNIQCNCPNIYVSTKIYFLLVYGIMCRNIIKLRYIVFNISSVISMWPAVICSNIAGWVTKPSVLITQYRNSFCSRYTYFQTLWGYFDLFIV